MEEGERLSKKQLAQENTIKKLRSQLEEMRSEKGATAGTLAAERAKVCHSAACNSCVTGQITILHASLKLHVSPQVPLLCNSSYVDSCFARQR